MAATLRLVGAPALRLRALRALDELHERVDLEARPADEGAVHVGGASLEVESFVQLVQGAEDQGSEEA